MVDTEWRCGALRRFAAALLVAFAALPVLYVAIPILHLLVQTDGTDLLQSLRDPEFVQALATSVEAAIVTTAAALVFGLPTAFLLSRWTFPGKQVIEGLLFLPVVLPPLVGGIAQLSLYGPESTVGGWLLAHGLRLTDSLAGIVLAQSLVASPFLILAAKVGFDEVPRELREVTLLQGGNLWTEFWQVSLPLAIRSVAVGALLVLTRSMGEFGATIMMAYHPYTVPVYIWVSFSSAGLQGILPVAVWLALFAVLVVAVTSRKVARTTR